MKWFRLRKREEAAPAEAAAPPTLEQEGPARPDAAESDRKPAARRRRGSRGGRGRSKKKTTDGAGAVAEAEAPRAPATPRQGPRPT